MNEATTLRAIIPVAGLGTRMQPWTAAVPKALLPLVDARGHIRPVIHCILAEAARADITEAALVISPAQREPLEAYLENLKQLDASIRAELPQRLEMIVQDPPAGFGEAVLRTQRFAADKPVLVMLGDHVHIPAMGAPTQARQLAAAWAKHKGAALIGVQDVPESELSRVGSVRGEPMNPEGLYRCTAFIEKPDIETARRELHTPGLPEGRYLAHNGLYIFGPEIYDLLSEQAASTSHGEVELAAAQSRLLQRHPHDYYLFHPAGRAYDVGTPAGYAQTFHAFHEHVSG